MENTNIHNAWGDRVIMKLAATRELDDEYIEHLFMFTPLHGIGYPTGKKGDVILLEARIVAVADVFDALTSKRPYKEAWPNDDAYSFLTELVGQKLDQEYVDVLINNRTEVEAIQRQFHEDPYG